MVIYISVQKLATMLNYEYYNSEYKKKGEDKTKCQVRIQNEYTSYIANSNKMYKTIVTKNTDDKDKNNTSNTTNTNDEQQVNQNNNDEEYEYFTIDNNIKYVNDEIYASTQAIMLGFDVSISYDTKKNTIAIYSPDYMETLAKSNRSDTVPSTEYEYINKRLLKYGMSIVKNSDGNLGVGSYTNQDKLTSFVASCKYSSIKFNEATKTLEVTTSGDNKKCVLRLNTDNQTVEKNMDSQYDDIKEIDNDFKYFLIKDKEKSKSPANRPPYVYQVPLTFIPGVGNKTIDRLLDSFGTEMTILHKLSKDDIEAVVGEKVANEIIASREGKMKIHAGGGGVYGKVTVG